MISPAGIKLESRIVHRPGHKRRGHDHCDIDTPSMTMVRTAVSGNNLMQEISERWDCQREVILNHFCVILDKTSFSKAKLLGFYGKISKKITIKVRGYCLIK